VLVAWVRSLERVSSEILLVARVKA
jgi:hypothetical protein